MPKRIRYAVGGDGRRAGRSAGSGKYGEDVRVSMEPETRELIVRSMELNKRASVSEAARELIKLGLKAEGLI